ncbi:hypothetical protein CK203_072589 [Vitis vinifera]|uniref:Uncharacterized protein n=1 Tax=Vitis vinifera TaxID=29760 RepID=A0A438F914_VITVI|nr:hypothetical protein CK203_072589 [Vitis vinifera]
MEVSGYLMESVKDVYKTVSVSQKGAQFLSSSTPAHQPKLVLQVTNEMVDDEEHEGTSGKFGELKGLATFEYEGFSEKIISPDMMTVPHLLKEVWRQKICAHVWTKWRAWHVVGMP